MDAAVDPQAQDPPGQRLVDAAQQGLLTGQVGEGEDGADGRRWGDSGDDGWDGDDFG
ncbi:hypothetical protein OG535_03320 [Kitasatospora sp. NBC_00085]|uniref:hypothetical protein n=1 Tax=unclassified Kitasatospora TaxID=2633591 RepID=UPI002F911561